MHTRPIIRVILLVIAALAAWKGYDLFLKKTPESPYEVVSKEGPYELRMYGPQVFAQTTQSGNWVDAGRAGFMLLADYIFARKASHTPIPMTAPVLSTAHKRGWTTRFVLPDGMTRATAPKPYTQDISLISTDARTVAAVAISGTPTVEQWHTHEQQLRKWLRHTDYRSCGRAWYARYNPPWTPSFMRRNEILLPVRKK